ncbi:hypothetical protein N1851_019855 [Merluccius polli]|uniref:Uncharacterized protein n=1 Tax=Merluccius polli TaxID=89951 RepID=A0AA47NXG5_MERPO|nr:hypothetical protein N1851_019855 [Merluccius polli]
MKRFERYRIASGLDRQSEEFQVNAFMYAAGDDAEDILSVLPLSDTDKKSYESVIDAFEKHCVSKRNVIYERACFNRRSQQPGESVESFITAVHTLAEHCQFRALREELIRDRIVVGILDAKLSESLQLDAELTLAKAMTKVRQSAAVKKQQPVLRGAESSAGHEDFKAQFPTVFSGLGKLKEPYTIALEPDAVPYALVRSLPQLQPGQDVWLTRERKQGTIIQKAVTPRSYLIHTDEGQLRRNRTHLRPVQNTQPQTTPDTDETPDNGQNLGNTDTPTDTTRESKSHTHTEANNTYVTSSGRVSRPPGRLDL